MNIAPARLVWKAWKSYGILRGPHRQLKFSNGIRCDATSGHYGQGHKKRWGDLGCEKGSSLQIQVRAYVFPDAWFSRGVFAHLLFSKAYTDCAICFKHFYRGQNTRLELHSPATIGFFGIPSNVEVAAFPAIGNTWLIPHERNSQLPRDCQRSVRPIFPWMVQTIADFSAIICMTLSFGTSELQTLGIT